MTKVQSNRVKSLIASGAKDFAAVLLFGPDQGLVQEYRKQLVAAVVDDPNDPFRVVELTGKQLKDEPARLWDEATAQSLIGGRRAIVLRDCGDAVSATFKPFVEQPEGDALIVLEAGELNPRSSLRKLFEQGKTVCAIGCYPDDGRNLGEVIRESLGLHNLKASPQALQYLMDNLGADRQITRTELEKLALYCLGQSEVTLEDAEACVGDNGLASLDAVLDAAMLGQIVALERGLNRAFEEGNNAVVLVRALIRRLDRLDLVRAALDSRQPMDQAMKVLRPPVNFKQADAFRAQAARWSRSMIARGREIALEAEIVSKSSGGLPDIQVTRAFLRLAQAARQAQRRSA